MKLFTGGRVADAHGTRPADVLIEQDRIVAVGDRLHPEAFDGTVETEVDVTGQVLAPGLIDSHVHLVMDGRADTASLTAESEHMAAFNAAANLEAAIKQGVTTVRDLGAIDTIGVDAKQAVMEGTLDGPRVLASGTAITMTGGHGHWFGREADGQTAVRQAAREQLKHGADVLKCIATGGVLTEGAVTGAVELTEAELRAAVEAGQPTNTPTAAHAHGTAGIKNAVRAGVASVEHGTYMDHDAAEMMADAGTVWVPTVSALRGIVDNGVEAGIPADAVEKGKAAEEAFTAAWDAALDAGVTIAMGTDAGTPFNRFEDIPDELAYMVDYGLSPADALKAATVNAASLLGLDDVGTIEPGMQADMVLLDADPNQDAEAWGDPAAVYRNGTQVH